MSDKKPTIIDRCKNLKAVFDALSILKKLGVVLGFLSSLGGIGYFATDTDEPGYAPAPSKYVKPASDNAVKVPEYALKDHAHPQPAPIIMDCRADIQQAITEYNKKHDPQKLGH